MVVCAGLMLRAGYYVHLHRIDDLVALFNDDGWVERMGDRCTGRAAIRGFLAGRDPALVTRHVLAPPMIGFTDADEGQGVAFFTLFDVIDAGGRTPLAITLQATVGEMSEILNVRQVPTLLGVHPNSVRSYAKAGLIPAAKIGRGWRFLEADLVAWLRGRYSGLARMQLSADHKEATTWHSGSVQVSTISTSQPRTEHELDASLGRPTGKRRENTTTG